MNVDKYKTVIIPSLKNQESICLEKSQIVILLKHVSLTTAII